MIGAYITWKHFKGKQEVRFSSSAIPFRGVLTSAQNQIEILRETVGQLENNPLHALPPTASAHPETTTVPTAIAAASPETSAAASKATTAAVELTPEPIATHPKATSAAPKATEAATATVFDGEPYEASTTTSAATAIAIYNGMVSESVHPTTVDGGIHYHCHAISPSPTLAVTTGGLFQFPVDRYNELWHSLLSS